MAKNGVALPHAAALAEFRDEYLECRDGNHAWSRPQYSFENRDRLVVRTRTCGRCTAVQTAAIVRHTGEYLGHVRISYPTGYLMKGTGRVRKYEVRHEAVRRAYVELARARREVPEEVEDQEVAK